jgi:hypothetical protein
MTLGNMREHVIALIKRHDIYANWVGRPDRAQAVHEFEEIWIAPIYSEISYATALHEIGHILGRYQTSHSMLVRERWAWQWARRNALMWTQTMERSAATGMARYALHAAKMCKPRKKPLATT